jgi:Holliday junction resolvase RusA-like endonuclease
MESKNETIKIVIPGKPVPKGRPRFTKSGHAFTPQKTRKWEKHAQLCAKKIMSGRKPITGPIHITVIAMLEIPKSWPEWKKSASSKGYIAPTGKPDKNNIVKAAEDALNGVVWVDDGQVVSSSEIKRYNVDTCVIVIAELLPYCPSNVTSRKMFEQFINNKKGTTYGK